MGIPITSRNAGTFMQVSRIDMMAPLGTRRVDNDSKAFSSFGIESGVR
jgi:hypothetical protein